MNIHQQLQEYLGEKNVEKRDHFGLLKAVSSATITDLNSVRDVVIRILDKWDEIPEGVKVAWNSIIETTGLYPYMRQELMDGVSALRYEFHRSPNLKEIIFHDEQQVIWNALESGKSTILSAPTSFGKSLMIEDIIASHKYKNIVIVQPTLALLDETRIKLLKYKDYYNLIVSTTEPAQERNIFLLTAERVTEYQDMPEIDFFVIDEFYKLSIGRDDERSIALNIALYKLLKQTENFYFLGPNIYKISEGFTERFDAHWLKSDFATVAVDTERITGARGGTLEGAKRKQKLFELLSGIEGQTLVYCSDPRRATECTNEYAKYLRKKNLAPNTVPEKVQETIEWVKHNIHEDWSLISTLESGTAFHHGSIPRHLGSSIIEHFNAGEIQVLFCTSTIIEGVNTTAKNVVLYDMKKGLNPIDYFDFKNISGRSGRMRKHFIGKVFQFDSQPEASEIEVDIPIFSQKNAPLELLIQIDRETLTSENRELVSEFHKLPDGVQELIKSNTGAPIEGQLAVIKMLQEDTSLHPLLNWKGRPTWEQLKKAIELCFEYLIFRHKGSYTIGQIVFKVNSFLRTPSIKVLIDQDIEKNYSELPHEKLVQKAVEGNLYLARNWFSFILPKSLGVLNNLQKYVYEGKRLSAGNYSGVIASLENEAVPQVLLPLLDYSVPVSALKKIAQFVNLENDLGRIIEQIKRLDLNRAGLLSYEQRLIKRIWLD